MGATGLTIGAVGDVCLGDSLISLGFGTRSLIADKPPGFLFEPVRPLLEGCDLLFGNLECVLSDSGLVASRPTSRYLRGAPADVKVLAAAGFDLVNVANNHTMQYGAEAFEETVAALDEQGIEALGIGGQGPYHSRPVICERDGHTLGFLGYSYEWEQYFSGRPLYAVGDDDRIISDIVRLRREVDTVIVSLHWGLEYMVYPSADMVNLARKIVEAGAAIILGHHSHVPMGQEAYRNGRILYSLGNFVFDKVWWPTSLRTLVATIEIPATDGQAPLLTRHPARIGGDYRPGLLTGIDAQRELAWYSHLDDLVAPSRRRPQSWYTWRQKALLAALVPRKILHIVRSQERYERDIRRWLFKHKILRIG